MAKSLADALRLVHQIAVLDMAKCLRRFCIMRRHLGMLSPAQEAG
jgi:hypothetical protein